jgi:predicted RNA binding protein YcfA (HicA-like mRNA interferase family)
MSKRAKRLQKIRQNPRNVSFADLKQVLLDFGVVLNHSTGSHHIFEIADTETIFVVPYRNPVKIIYVKKALELIDQLISHNVPEESLEIDEDTDDESQD